MADLLNWRESVTESDVNERKVSMADLLDIKESATRLRISPHTLRACAYSDDPGQSFRLMADSCSDRCRTLVPKHPGHSLSERSDAGFCVSFCTPPSRELSIRG